VDVERLHAGGVSKLCKNRARSVGHSWRGVAGRSALWAAAQHRFKTDAALPPAGGEETRATRSALEGSASQSPRSLSQAVGRVSLENAENLGDKFERRFSLPARFI